jgi:hypothetical protein
MTIVILCFVAIPACHQAIVTLESDMMEWFNSIASAMVLWTLLCVPTLCRGGVLRHPCNQGGVSCCTTAACDSACDEALPDSHEGDCQNDPCQTFVHRDEGPGTLDWLIVSDAPFADLHDCAAQAPADLSATLMAVDAPPRTQLPFADSDIPLLI